MPLIAIGLVALLNLGVLSRFLLSFEPRPSLFVYRVDLDVYRIGAEVWLAGGGLYEHLPLTLFGKPLPFTYPPVSAVLLSPLALVSYDTAGVVLTVSSIAALALVVVVVLRSLDVRVSWRLVGLLLPAALLVEPVRETLGLGQVNLLLMALVVTDCLVRRPKWPRGVLVGVAAAVKLTPAAFVLFFLLRGDRRAALTAGASFLCVTAVGFVLNGGDSVRYWTSTLWDPDRIGKVTQASNQTFNGLLARLGVERGLLWLLLVGAVVGLAAVGMRRAFAEGRQTLALGLNALAVLLASPVSWSHHWVWAVPILLVAGVSAWRTRTPARVGLAVAGVVLVVVSPHWWWEGEETWSPVRLTVGHAYLWCAVLVLVGWLVRSRLVGTRCDPTPNRQLAGLERGTRVS